jgi:CubicO group peptidase (beta-lactamase class C family)
MNLPMARPGGEQLELSRVYKASRERVFAAWTDPDKASRWWVPQDCELVSCKMDVRPGGGWHRRMRVPDGGVISKWGEYREVLAPERLVFTYNTEFADGTVDPETLVTVTFNDLGDGYTRLTLRHERFWSEAARDSHTGGWDGSLERLVLYMSGGPVAGGFSKERLGRLHNALAAHVGANDIPGLVALVSRGDQVHVKAFGVQSIGGSAMRRNTIFRIASMTKPVIAAATLMLVEQGKLRLDDPVDDFLPELANRKVLRAIDGPVEDTVPARRPITTRDLLTFTFGIGAVMVWPPKYPIQHAAAAVGLVPGPFQPDFTADEFMKRLGSLPLFHQPGERWLYHTGSDVLGVLIARASGQPLESFLHKRLFAPLGMRDTGFQVPAAKLGRLASAYMMDRQTGKLSVFDDAKSSRWSKPPPFAAGGSGLVSTADDFHAFYRMLLKGGMHGGERLLSRPTVQLMMSDQLTAEQKKGADLFFGNGASWGMGGAVVTRRTDIFAAPGRFGWDGGYGTSAHLDPTEDTIGVLLTQRMMESPVPPKVFRDFWTGAYQAFDD